MSKDKSNLKSMDVEIECAKMDKFIDTVTNAMESQYASLLDNTVSEDLTNFYRDFKKYTYAQYQRFRKIADSQYIVKSPHNNMITISFTFKTSGGSATYGLLYCHKGTSVVPLFILSAPSLQSQDGEYRGRVIDFIQFTSIYEHYGDMLSKIEDTLLEDIGSGELTLEFTIHAVGGISKLQSYLENSRIALKLYIACFLRDLTYIKYGIEENHMNIQYKSAMNTERNLHALCEVEKALSCGNIEDLIKHFSKCYESLEEPESATLQPEVGHKLTPLSVSAITHVGDPRKSVWREIHFAQLVTNLVVNLICPGFPVFYHWTLASGGADIYDNSEMHLLYQNSGDARIIKQHLLDTPTSPDKRLIGYINRAEVYSDESLIFTDKSVVALIESVGRTFRDISKIALSERFKYNEVRTVFTDPRIFKSLIFQYLYNIYCMNTHCGLQHTDLHMNNVTLYNVFHGHTETGKKILPDPRIMFRCVDKNYVFDFIGIYACIIDFSRGIYCGDYAVEPLNLPHDFYDKQNDRVAAYIYQLFPEFFLEHKNTILGNILTDYKQVFKIISVFDAYTLITNISNRVDADPLLRDERVNPPPQELVDWIHGAERIVKNAAEQALSNLVGIGFATEQPWPVLSIIEQLFSEWVVPSDKLSDLVIVDTFNSNFKHNIDFRNKSTQGVLFDLDPAHDIYVKIFGHSPESWPRVSRFLNPRDESAEFAELAKTADATEPIEYPEWMFR